MKSCMAGAFYDIYTFHLDFVAIIIVFCNITRKTCSLYWTNFSRTKSFAETCIAFVRKYVHDIIFISEMGNMFSMEASRTCNGIIRNTIYSQVKINKICQGKIIILNIFLPNNFNIYFVCSKEPSH